LFPSIAAVLFGLLALSNFLEPILADSHTGFVFFGRRLSGIANEILGPLFGFILVAYVIGIWQMRPYALPLGWAYAAYVVANGALFSMHTTDRPPSPAFMVVSLVLGLGIPIGSAIVLTQNRTH
jgi:hypothetical protein